jgi:hypothetical protein
LRGIVGRMGLGRCIRIDGRRAVDLDRHQQSIAAAGNCFDKSRVFAESFSASRNRLTEFSPCWKSTNVPSGQARPEIRDSPSGPAVRAGRSKGQRLIREPLQ